MKDEQTNNQDRIDDVAAEGLALFFFSVLIEKAKKSQKDAGNTG